MDLIYGIKQKIRLQKSDCVRFSFFPRGALLQDKESFLRGVFFLCPGKIPETDPQFSRSKAHLSRGAARAGNGGFPLQ